jgi:D-lactate dehydrogenase
MKIAIFSTQDFEREFFDAANNFFRHELVYFRERLHDQTARLAAGFPAVCVFITDQLDGRTLATLVRGGVRLIALRSAGFNNVDLAVTDRPASPGLFSSRRCRTRRRPDAHVEPKYPPRLQQSAGRRL